MNHPTEPAPIPAEPARSGVETPTPICAIGASAGGVRALQDFFAAVNDRLGIAYVVIVHLSPDHPSALSEILASRTTMPVHQVEDTARLKPDCVHVIPPDRELVITGDDLTARPFTEPRGRRSPIDMFFRSVAAARGDGAAVVLTGAGSDGALGVRAVKEAGGVVFVQDPTDAEYPMMPRSAIATGVVDFVGTVEGLAARLAEVVRSKAAVRRISEADLEQDLRQVISFLRARTGHDFASYKRATLMRRVLRRMQVTRQESLGAYHEYLRSNPEEAKELFSDLLISVTMFFRDREAFARLAEKAVKPLFDRLEGDAPIRVWAAGCATGEEAYSIGMLLLEEAERRGQRPAMQVFATDLDDGALATAREGRYPRAIETDLTEERIRRFFIEEGAHYRVRKELRDLVLFASHSALKDPPFIHLDLVACRNLLIYLERDLQRQLNALFHYALKPGGFLFLGSAETVDATPSLFDTVDRDARIYVARPQPNRIAPVLPQLQADHRALQHAARPHSAPAGDQPALAGQAHAAALERRAPPSALVDAAGHLLHLSPTLGRYMLPSEGPFTAELAAMVRPELRVDLKLALRRALEEREATLTPPVPVGFNGDRRLVALHILPTRPEPDGPAGGALVFFLDGGVARTPDAEPAPDEQSDRTEVRRLRQELAVAQDRLANSRADHEQATQELRAANEELQSINEEYRSTAEELETSKEELQSINEELQTVNAELKAKLETISTAHNDLQNLMAATEIGTLFLDPELRIKLFTPAVTRHFNITLADLGRALTDFTHRLAYDEVERDAREVLRTLVPMETEVATRDGHWLMMRLRPYRTVDDRIEGVVVTFSDITARKQAEQSLAEELRAMARLQSLSTRVIASAEVDEPLGNILEATIELVGADFGNIQLLDAPTGTLRIAVQRGFDERFLQRFAHVAAGDGSACGQVLATGRQVLIPDVEAEPSYRDSLEEARAAGYRAVQSTPLFADGEKLVGVLSTHFREPRSFSPQHLRLIDICARQAADAINAFLLRESLLLSERRLRRVLETDTVGVIFFDNAGTLVDANDGFLRMTGYTRSQVEAGELNWRRMTPEEWVAESERQMAKLAETGSIGPYEKEYLCADGSHQWMLFAGRRIEDNLIAEYCIDISDRKHAEQERELLALEMEHRVKNTLAVVHALVLQSSAETVAEFKAAFLGRLQALSRAHTLLRGAGWRNARLNVVVAQAISAFRLDDPSRVATHGPTVMLSARQALGLSLVLHELATNAMKYGALSGSGRLEIGWKIEAEEDGKRHVRLEWTERGGPPARPPAREGFGSKMIRRAGAHELAGKVEITYSPEGFGCEILFPLEEGVSSFERPRA